ncbi:sensor histidine kinase [Sutterella megalosphaeroides]|uniref:histidine kinase n=1 Tax=Sutterella megalosphaeroides TaxID=2494234 RepID=A0A2Z6I7B1_9BURK|nr:ATP-binding protein [Sutterella megalosphaeroides]BBF22274.1 two-component sensor histidine kinase [Sutterella megalosphaeroides]
MPHWYRYALTASLALAAISLFGLAATSSDSRLFERWFPLLIVINRVVAVLLFAIVVAMLVQLWQRFRRRRFGANMTVRLAGATAALAVVPALVIFLVSNVFISRSIDSWFDVRVERALESGVTITRGILQQQQKQTELTARHMAGLLANTPTSLIMQDLMRLLEGHQSLEALVFLGDGTAVAAAGSRINVMLPDLPTAQQMQVVRSTGIYSVIDGDVSDKAEALRTDSLSIRVILPLNPRNDETTSEASPPAAPRGLAAPRSTRNAAGAQQLYLQIIQPVDNETAQNASELLAGYRDYQTLVLSRASLQSIYTGTLFLTLLLAVFGAIAAAITFARKAAEPVLQLEEGTRRVADGNFSPIREFTGSSEINVLTQSFNQMIREVAETRRDIDEQRREAQQAQAYLERVLGNITSGVMVIDRTHTVVTANAAARRILGDEVCAIGTTLETTEPRLVEALTKMRHLATDANMRVEFELQRPDRVVPLYIKTSNMPLGAHMGTVLVLDDVSQLIEAQRATAWGEVARRLAHEIKNPLTPIRLAAERLEMKLENRLEDQADVDLLHRAIATITTQVDALKQMVNDFREYARLPSANLVPLDLNAFLTDAASLYHQAGTEVTLRLDPTLPAVLADASQLRQVIHNLISNSIDAAGAEAEIEIQTRSDASPDGPSTVRLIFRDNGTGFSSKILAKAFEPYVTTKETGTGLGLPMVKKILDEHHASIELSNRMDRTGYLILGAQVDIRFPVFSSATRTTPVSDTQRTD